MSSIELCKTIKETFFASIYTEPLASASRLGNLYLKLDNKLKKEKSNQVNLEQTLAFVKKNIKPDHINILWNVIKENTKPPQSTLLLEGSKLSIVRLQHEMLTDPLFFQSISQKNLIEIGQDRIWSDKVLIALLRRHCFEKKMNDPFAQDFNYQHLEALGDEQSYDYLQSFLNQLKTVPIEPILRLAKNPSMAEGILNHFSVSFHFFEVSYHLALAYPELAGSIAQKWQNKFTSFPFSKEQKRQIEGRLNQLNAEFPEQFAQVDPEGYVNRAHVMGRNLPTYIYRKVLVLTSATLSSIASVAMLLLRRSPGPIASNFVPCVNAVCTAPVLSRVVIHSPLSSIVSSLATTAAPVFIPAACLAGVGYIAFPYVKKALETPQNQSERLSP